MSASPKHARFKDLASNLAVLATGVVGSVLLLEAALRFHNPLQTRIKGDRIVLTANTRARYRSHLARRDNALDSMLTVSRNALGFRGPDPPARFAESLTLFTVGGSTTRCGMQSDDKTWTAHLGNLLRSSFRNVWINNAGLDGHTTHGHLVLLEDHIARLHPKIVIFLVGVNDIIVGPGTERDAENIRGEFRWKGFKPTLKTLSAHSEVVALGLDVYRSVLAHGGGLGYHQVDLAGLVDYDATPAEARAEQDALLGSGRLVEYGARLERLIAACRAAGIEPIFLTQPLLVGHCLDDVTGRDLGRVGVGQRRNGGMLWDLLEAHNDVTRRVCRERNVFWIDLAREVPKSSRYFFDFMHFNNDGTVLVADIVAGSLCPHVARRYPTFVTQPCPPPPGPGGPIHE